MRNIEEFDSSLRLTKTALLMSGVKVFDTKYNNYVKQLSSVVYYINIVCLYAVLIGEIYYFADGIQNGRNIVELSLISPCITISVLGTVKIHFLYSNTDVMANIVDHLRNIHSRVNDDSTGYIDEELEDANEEVKTAETKIIKTSINFLNKVTILLAVISGVVLSMFCFSPLVKMMNLYIKGEEIEKILYPYSVKYTFDIYNTPFWYLFYINQVLATAIVCSDIYGSDTLFYALCTYIEMHFRLLSNSFENIVSPSMNDISEKLVKCIRRHQELIYLVNQIEGVYSKSTLFNFVTSSLLICLSAFSITVAKDVSTIFSYITFLVMSLSQISLLCFFGDMLMKSSTEVCGAIYKCPWYNIDEGIKKSIILVMLRAQKPCKLTAANFADLNLRAFTTILSRSWSYFALLKTVYN